MWTGQLQSAGFWVRGDGLNEDVWLMGPQLPQDRGLVKGQFRGWKAHADNRSECKDQRHSSPCPPPPTHPHSTSHRHLGPRLLLPGSLCAGSLVYHMRCFTHEQLVGLQQATSPPEPLASSHQKKVPISQRLGPQIHVPIPHMAGHM